MRSSSAIVHMASPTAAPMSAVIMVEPSGASHGIDSVASHRRKNGVVALREPHHRVGQQAAALQLEVDEHEAAEAEGPVRLEHVGALDQLRQHADGRGADDRRRLQVPPTGPQPDGHAVFDVDLLDRRGQLHEVAQLVGDGLAQRGHALLRVHVVHAGRLGLRPAVADGHGPVELARREPQPQRLGDALGDLVGDARRQFVGRHARPRLHERDGDLVGHDRAVLPPEALGHRASPARRGDGRGLAAPTRRSGAR